MMRDLEKLRSVYVGDQDTSEKKFTCSLRKATRHVSSAGDLDPLEVLAIPVAEAVGRLATLEAEEDVPLDSLRLWLLLRVSLKDKFDMFFGRLPLVAERAGDDFADGGADPSGGPS